MSETAWQAPTTPGERRMLMDDLKRVTYDPANHESKEKMQAALVQLGLLDEDSQARAIDWFNNHETWTPPTTDADAKRTRSLLTKMMREDPDNATMFRVLGEVGINTPADFEKAGDWHLEYIDKMTLPQTLMNALALVTWRFSLLALFWLVFGIFALIAGPPIIGGGFAFLVGGFGIGYSIYLFAGGQKKFGVL